MMLLKSNYFGERIQPPLSIVPVAMFVLFFEMKKAGIVEWTRSHTSSIATHMIGPALLIHVTIFAQHTLIIVVLTTDLVTKHW